MKRNQNAGLLTLISKLCLMLPIEEKAVSKLYQLLFKYLWDCNGSSDYIKYLKETCEMHCVS